MKYGSMRTEEYQKKMEYTDMLEDDDTVNKFMRRELKEIGPDTPFMESDQIRGGLDENGDRTRAYQSKEPLSVRYGGRRTNTDPYLPDGTFLDHQFVGPGHLVEPRSIMLGPDMSKLKEQGRRRGKFVKFNSDASPSIAEKGWHPAAIAGQMADMRVAFKSYYKNFSTALVGWHSGGTSSAESIGKISEQSLLASDQRYSPISKLEAIARASRTPHDNDAVIGWRTSADHRLKVAKLGHAFKSKPLSDVVSYTNRRSVKADHEIFDVIEGNILHRSLATAILKLSEENRRVLASEIDSGAFARSRTVADRKRFIKELINGKWNPNFIATQSQSTLSESVGKTTKQKSRVLDDRIGKVMDLRKIAKQIISGNGKLAKREIEQLVDKIVSTQVKNTNIKEQTASKSFSSNKANLRENIENAKPTQIAKESKKVANYGTMGKKDPRNSMKAYNNNADNIPVSSMAEQKKSMGGRTFQYTPSVSVSETEYGTEFTTSSTSGPMKIDRSAFNSMVYTNTSTLKI
jgi:hypothetical protein